MTFLNRFWIFVNVILFKSYSCVCKNDTLCSQSRLIHFLTSYFKNFVFLQSFSDEDYFSKFSSKNKNGYICILILPMLLGFFLVIICVVLLTDCLEKLYISDLKKHTVVESSKMQPKTVYFFKEFFVK